MLATCALAIWLALRTGHLADVVLLGFGSRRKNTIEHLQLNEIFYLYYVLVAWQTQP
jgi:hypothetical protein